MKIKYRFPLRHRSGRRRGASLVYMALGLPVFLGITGMVVDMGFLYYRRAEAQKAADAAALAGAMRLPDTTAAEQAARWMAGLNGYNANITGVIVTGQPAPDGNPNHYGVTVQKPEPLFFMAIFGMYSKPVGATAWAEYLSQAPLNISGGGTYGVNGPVTLSLFGPDGAYNNGDAYSVRKLANGGANPLYDGKGYDFVVDLPTSMGRSWLEIFDPDCYNKNDSPDADGTNRIDELRNSSGGTGNSSHATTTQYSLYWDAGTPLDLTDDILIRQQSYGDTSSTDMRWITFADFNRSSYPGGKFRLNVLSTDGSSENGFNLRAGPRRTSTQAFNPTNGSSITAEGRLPMNFNTSGTVDVTLGYVPGEAAGGKMFIDKFDTDVGAKNIIYTCDSLPGRQFTGVLSDNGTWVRDSIDLPTDFTGGTWKARYQAGVQDTSVWTMSFSNTVPGRPGQVRLIK